jgi:hypothetical protein
VRTRRISLPLVLTVLALAGLPQPALGQVAPDLGGEEWRVGTDFGGTLTTSWTCEPDRASLTLDASGPATGPYPGTFTEHYEVALGPPLVAEELTRNATSLTASFTIDSITGYHVEGTKTYEPSTPHTGECDQRVFGAGGVVTAYEATITAPDGCTYVDRGSAGADVSSLRPGPESFGEVFLTDGVPPAAVGPCAGGGGEGDDDDGDDGGGDDGGRDG